MPSSSRYPGSLHHAAHAHRGTTPISVNTKRQLGSQHDGAHSPQTITPTTNNSHRQYGPHKHTAHSHPTPQITKEEAIYIWSHSVLLADNFEISESLLEHKRLLRVCGNTIPRALLRFNMGSLWSVANHTTRATTAFEEACREDPTLTISWFCLGVSHFSVQNYAAALDAFENCLSTYATESEMVKTYEHHGLDFKLEKTRVSWNVHLTKHRLAKERGLPTTLTLANPLNTIRKDLYFHAPELELGGTEGDDGSSDPSWKDARRRSALEKLTSGFKKLRKFSQDFGKEKRDSGFSQGTATTTTTTRKSEGSNWSK